MGKKPAFSVTLKDCDVQTFRSGGKGGQNQNKRDTGVRIVHRPSGAVGESREERSQLQNKRTAFKRMAEHPKFKIWVNRELFFRGESPEERVEKDMRRENLLVQGRVNDTWMLIP
jgi:protein subunit release factor B